MAMQPRTNAQVPSCGKNTVDTLLGLLLGSPHSYTPNGEEQSNGNCYCYSE